MVEFQISPMYEIDNFFFPLFADNAFALDEDFFLMLPATDAEYNEFFAERESDFDYDEVAA